MEYRVYPFSLAILKLRIIVWDTLKTLEKSPEICHGIRSRRDKRGTEIAAKTAKIEVEDLHNFDCFDF